MGRHTMRASTRAAIGVVSELMNMPSTLGILIVTGYVVADGCRGGFGRLLKLDGTLDLGVTANDRNYCRRGGVSDG